MSFDDLQKSDRALCKAATETMWDSYEPERHWVGCALRTDDGNVYTGINLEAYIGTAAVHAEPVAVASAIQAGDATIRTVVTVHTPDGDYVEVISPCGGCRELLWTFAPECSVLVDDGDSVYRRPIADLLPAMPYTERPD